MQRGRKKEQTHLPKWKKKLGSGSIKLPGWKRRIKPGESFRAKLSDVAPARNQFELIEDGTGDYSIYAGVNAEQKPEPTVIPPEGKALGDKFDVVSVGGGYYNVVSPAGKVMNEKALRQPAAEAFLKQLEKPSAE